jgi:uncharacterized protein GlcG (DUF336 family)
MRKAGISIVAAALALAACGSGDDGEARDVGTSPAPSGGDSSTGSGGCSGSCATANTFLTTDDVQGVIARAVAEAQARNTPATIAVVDRVGNVLGVFAMTGASATVTVTSQNGGSAIDGGLEGVNIIPASLAAIAKAVTGAYLSSEGNAFSTRTASQIVQEHFNPGEALASSGPLSGVQFSQLPCSDLNTRFTGGAPDVGPKRSPLGLSADPGGFPLYKGGTPVGGVGVIADGIYSLDRQITDRDADDLDDDDDDDDARSVQVARVSADEDEDDDDKRETHAARVERADAGSNSDLDEKIALAATFGFAAPADRRAGRFTVDGRSLRFSDASLDDLQSSTSSPPSFDSINGTAGTVIPVNGYFAGTVVAGTPFGQPASGIRPDTLDYPGLDAFVLVDATNTERFRPRAGTEGTGALTETEVREILRSALATANRTRAQIRRPFGLPAAVTITVVDSTGVILGIARTRDAPLFGIDVSVQKARTAAFFSSSQAASLLTALPDAVYLNGGLTVLRNEPLGQYVTALQSFTGLPTVLADGQVAFTTRAIGNLARLFYPDGIDGNPAGPLAKPAGEWSIFSTGVQLDLVYNALVQHVGFVLGAAPDVPQNCTGVSGFDSMFAPSGVIAGLADGIQIFPGSAPIYRDRTLVGAVGVSGDGVDQDDLVAFYGLQDAALRLGSFSQAPIDMRADQLQPAGARLRYIGCPQAPFTDSDTAEPCRDF